MKRPHPISTRTVTLLTLQSLFRFLSFNIYQEFCNQLCSCPDPHTWLYIVCALCAVMGMSAGVLLTLAIQESRRTRLSRKSEHGNIFAMLFAATTMVGVLSVVGMQTVMGPVTTITKVTQKNLTENDLLMNAKVVVMNAATLPKSGDVDEDGYIEPVPFIPTTDPGCLITLPGSGGCLPADIGAIQTDPWGTQYAYCVWDHGDPASSTRSEEHTSELQSLMRISYAVFCVKKKK